MEPGTIEHVFAPGRVDDVTPRCHARLVAARLYSLGAGAVPDHPNPPNRPVDPPQGPPADPPNPPGPPPGPPGPPKPPPGRKVG